MVPKEVKKYLLGNYGKSPAEIDASVYKIIKIDIDQVNTSRLADSIKFDIESIRNEFGDIFQKDEDLLSYILFPQVALPFLRKKHDPFYDISVQTVTVTY